MRRCIINMLMFAFVLLLLVLIKLFGIFNIDVNSFCIHKASYTKWGLFVQRNYYLTLIFDCVIKTYCDYMIICKQYLLLLLLLL